MPRHSVADPDFKGIEIWIADDIALEDLEANKRALESYNARVKTFRDPFKLVEALESEKKPNLIITDWNFSKIKPDNVEPAFWDTHSEVNASIIIDALRELKKKGKEIPFVILTGMDKEQLPEYRYYPGLKGTVVQKGIHYVEDIHAWVQSLGKGK